MSEENIEQQLPTDAEAAMRAMVTATPEIQTEDKKEDKPGSQTPADDKPTGDEKPAGETTPEKDEKPVVESQTETVVEDKFDAEIDAEDLPANASEKSKKGFSTVKSKAKEEHRLRVEAETKAAKLEADRKTEQDRIAALEKDVPTEEQKQEIERLRQFHETFGIENDPGLTSPFDQRVTAANQSLEGVMKQLGVPEGTIKFINDNGGLYAFRSSGTKMPRPLPGPDGKPVQLTQAQFYKQYVEPNLSQVQKDEIDDAFLEIRKANREKTQAVEHLKANRGEYLKKRDESIKAAQADWAARVNTHAEVVKKNYGDVAKLQEIQPTDAPEVKAAKEKHNEQYKTAEAKALKIISQVTPENLVEAAIAAGYVDVLKGQVLDLSNTNEKIKAERDDFQKKYEDLKKAGKTSGARHEAASITTNPKQFKNAEEAMSALVNQ